MAEPDLESDDTLARYAAGPAALAVAVAGLDDEALDATPDGGGWSIRQIVHHVADGDDIWKTCIKMALGNEGQAFDLRWYWSVPQEAWAERWAYRRLPIEPSLARLGTSRGQVVQLIELSPGSRQKAFTITWPGADEERLTVEFVLQSQADHVFQHIEEIGRIRAAGNR